jgi:hypothetical protein
MELTQRPGGMALAASGQIWARRRDSRRLIDDEIADELLVIAPDLAAALG